MDEKALFTDFWTKESKTTSKVIARIPEGSDYKPDPRSRTAQQIAWQVVCEEKMIIEALETGTAAWAPPPMPPTVNEIVDAYDRLNADMPARWKAIPDERWTGTVQLLRPRPLGVGDGVELLVRHRPPSRPDHHVFAADGFNGPSDLWA